MESTNYMDTDYVPQNEEAIPQMLTTMECIPENEDEATKQMPSITKFNRSRLSIFARQSRPLYNSLFCGCTQLEQL